MLVLRNIALGFVVVLAFSALCCAGCFGQIEMPRADRMPVTGEILPGSEPLDRLDEVMRRILASHEVPGAGLAIAHDGKLIVARGYGWADLEPRRPMEPTTPFDLASVSKSITAVGVLKLVEEGRLALDERAFERIGMLRAPPGRRIDPRLREVTIRMLLNHSGGWSRKERHGDPISYEERAHRELRVPLPVTAEQLIYYVNGERLDFDPGTEQVYSNYGFMVLGYLVEVVTGDGYARWVERNVLEPMGIRDVRMTPLRRPESGPEYLPGEAHRYRAGTVRALPGGHTGPTGAAGGWCASAVSMAKFLTAVDGTRTGRPFLDERLMQAMLARPEPPLEVRKNGSWFGLGWDRVRGMRDWPHEDENDRLAYGKDGGVPGISTWIEHLPGGIDWVVLFNASAHPEAQPERAERPSEAEEGNALQDAQKEVVGLLREVQAWPRGDLFEKYR